MSILKRSLYALYSGNDDILDMLDQLDYTQLDRKFNDELHSRISRQDAELAEMMLASELLMRYDTAIQQASMACTRDLTTLLELVLLQKEGRLQ